MQVCRPKSREPSNIKFKVRSRNLGSVFGASKREGEREREREGGRKSSEREEMQERQRTR